MGITYESARFLAGMRDAEVRFDRALTLGRQNFLVNDRQLYQLKRQFPKFSRLQASLDAYAEPFFREVLESQTVDSIDATSYEQATILHDLNSPIDPKYENSFDCVVDGGTLEHVFNFPVAMSNSLRALRVGGWFVSFSVVNNFVGHGFYQFSPELFFRIFGPAYGFSRPLIVLLEYPNSNVAIGRGGAWYRVVDPESLGVRVNLINHKPLAMMLAARKTAHVQKLFDPVPQQSDYSQLWSDQRGSERKQHKRSLYLQSARIPLLGNWIASAAGFYKKWRIQNLGNRRFFQRFTPSDLARHLPSFTPEQRME